MIGSGEASGERRAAVAAEEALSNRLLDDVSLKGAKGLLLSILGGRDLTLYEVDEATNRVRHQADPNANIIVGATFDESLSGRIRVSIVASGMPRKEPAVLGSHAPQSAFNPDGTAAGQSSDFEGALTRSIQQGAPAGQTCNERKPRRTWRGPGSVVIEEGWAQFAQQPAAPLPLQRDSDPPPRAVELF
jgi:cell division protein FtsZ